MFSFYKLSYIYHIIHTQPHTDCGCPSNVYMYVYDPLHYLYIHSPKEMTTHRIPMNLFIHFS